MFHVKGSQGVQGSVFNNSKFIPRSTTTLHRLFGVVDSIAGLKTREFIVGSKNTLLIFIKNPAPGKVKTRLAKTVGNEKAYQVYLRLLQHTLKAAAVVDAVRQVWYSSFINWDDGISETVFEKKLQQGSDLGERMSHAFESGFKQGAEKMVIIGSDCPDISTEIIEQAYYALKTSDVVIGPAKDGGYYLLGMNHYYPELFTGIEWSTGRVLFQTMEKIRKASLGVYLLPELIDIDTEDDLDNSTWSHP